MFEYECAKFQLDDKEWYLLVDGEWVKLKSILETMNKVKECLDFIVPPMK